MAAKRIVHKFELRPTDQRLDELRGLAASMADPSPMNLVTPSMTAGEVLYLLNREIARRPKWEACSCRKPIRIPEERGRAANYCDRCGRRLRVEGEDPGHTPGTRS